MIRVIQLTLIGSVRKYSVDLASVVLLGPADFFTLASSFSDPALAADGFHRHPPLAIRINYMTRCLDTLRGASSVFDSHLADWTESWESQVKETELTPNEERYVKGYSAIIEKYEDDLIEFVKTYVINKNDQFTPELWESIIAHYDSVGKGKTMLNESTTDIRVALNQGWAKRWIIFHTLFPRDAHSLEKFMLWHNQERKLLWETLDALVGSKIA